MIIANHGCLSERIGEQQLNTDDPISEQIQSKSYLRIPFSHTVNHIQHSTNHKHLSNPMVVQTDVPDVLNPQSLRIQLEKFLTFDLVTVRPCSHLHNSRVVGVLNRKNHPHTVIINAEIEIIILATIEEVGVVRHEMRHYQLLIGEILEVELDYFGLILFVVEERPVVYHMSVTSKRSLQIVKPKTTLLSI